MMKQFKIVVPSFNSVDFIGKTLASIENQTYKNYQVCVIDDCSTLKKQREIILEYCNKNKWKYRFHEKNYGALYGLVEGIRDLNCDDQDVIIVIDGDDWLYDEHALEKLHRVYAENDIYLSWGQCETYPPGKTPMKYAQPIPDMIIDQKLYREIPFVFWHLGTFKYYLWRHLDDRDLRDVNGEYFRVLKDKATLYPMLEMAGHKVKFISDTLYVYNISNPLNDYVTNPDEYQRVTKLLKEKSRYKTLEFPK